jgi:guanine deaminase
MNHPSSPASVTLHLGEIIHVASPPRDDAAPPALAHHRQGGLAVKGDGTILAAGDAGTVRAEVAAARLQATEVVHQGLILPGFVDAHLHFPQLDIIGAPGEQLLGWLERYTFPAESSFADPALAETTAERLITELYANGTTTAVIYSSSHKSATAKMFEVAEKRGLRAVIGKVSMDRNGPAALLQNVEDDALANEELISRWHGRNGLLQCAITPRFAPTCSDRMLAAHGALKKKHPGVYIQTHHSESLNEIAWVRELFPERLDYLDVYEHFGLLGKRTLLAHTIHPSPREISRIAATGTAVVHCPTSNLFLGSGLFRFPHLARHGIRVALGTDIGGGTSLSMWKTMGEAYKVQRLQGTVLSPAQLFHTATLGGAEALDLADQIGNFAPGKQADFQVVRPDRLRLLAHRNTARSSTDEILFALTILGDDRILESLWVKGRRVFAA